MVYVTSINPGEVKGPHLHVIRHSYYVCIKGKVVFISYTASDSENIPRHKTWFFSRNRLNVAISRAQSIVFVIFNSNLLLVSCKKIEEMKLLNNFCKLIKFKTIL